MSDTPQQQIQYDLNLTDRQRKGIILAVKQKITHGQDGWRVPSQSGTGYYTVVIDEPNRSTCTCEDFHTNKQVCKHIEAVRWFRLQQKRRLTANQKINDPPPDAKIKPRRTYKQDWPTYNLAQQTEQANFMIILQGICQTIPEPEQRKGRPRHSLAQAVFATVFKVHSLFSGRRFMSDMDQAHENGFLTRRIHYNTISRCLNIQGITPILQQLIEFSSLPLRALETEFAVDATGISTTRFFKSSVAKRGADVAYHTFVTLNAVCGVRTNIITSVHVSTTDRRESRHLPPLVKKTSEGFKVTKVFADKGYAGHDNRLAVKAIGAEPYIPFKHNAVGGYWDKLKPRDAALIEKLFHFYSYKREEFLKEYHKRSNVESTFAALKGKYGNTVRSKTDTARVNEVLCKVLCHNISILNYSVYKHNIDLTTFATESHSDPKV